jgi:metal-sulfur cluster biosynthetic enzyme
MATREQVEAVLSEVIDPELGLDFVELGLIYEIICHANTVSVTYTLTTPACPIGPSITAEMKERIAELEGVDDITITLIFRPAWTPENMSDDAKFALGYF